MPQYRRGLILQDQRANRPVQVNKLATNIGPIYPARRWKKRSTSIVAPRLDRYWGNLLAKSLNRVIVEWKCRRRHAWVGRGRLGWWSIQRPWRLLGVQE
jgi:hypothetical protein